MYKNSPGDIHMKSSQLSNNNPILTSFENDPTIEETLDVIQSLINQLSKPIKGERESGDVKNDLLTISETKENVVIKLAKLFQRISEEDAIRLQFSSIKEPNSRMLEHKDSRILQKILNEFNQLFLYHDKMHVDPRDKSNLRSVIQTLINPVNTQQKKELKKQPIPDWEHVVNEMLETVKQYRAHLAINKSLPLKEKSVLNKLFSSHVTRKTKQYEKEDKDIYQFEVLLNSLKNKEDVPNNYKKLEEELDKWLQNNKERIAKSTSKEGKGRFAIKMGQAHNMLRAAIPEEEITPSPTKTKSNQ